MVFSKMKNAVFGQDPSQSTQAPVESVSETPPKSTEEKPEEPDCSEDTPLIQSKERQITFDISGPGEGAARLYHDSPVDMTLSRKLAKFLSKYSWYYPEHLRAHTNLDDAWAYFEHTTLARYHVHGTDQSDHFLKAEPGEKDKQTKLYPVFATPEKDLADFGMGVGVYFWTLRFLAMTMFIAGVLSIPSLWYFWSPIYNPTPEFAEYEILRTSAVCSDQIWKACPTCTKSQWDYFPATFARYAEATTENGAKLTFIKINDCHITKEAGIASFVVMLFVLISTFVMTKVARKKEKFLDESQQTTSDYSVAVRNPPRDAKDAKEWKGFFGQFGHVTAITIAYDNEELLAQLMLRRSCISQLEDLMPPGKAVDPEKLDDAVEMAVPVPWYWRLYGTLEAHTLKKNIDEIDKLVCDDLAQREYGVAEVFVVYETESSQQAAMKALRIPAYQVMRNNASALEKNEYAFRGKHVLRVTEPPEPTSVRWKDLDESLMQNIRQYIITFFVTVFCIILGCAFVVYIRAKYGTIYGAFAVTAVTSAAPYICYYIIEYMESHPHEGSRQVSLYFKITAFLWVTATLLTAKITPFVETLDNKADSLVPAMFAIFITELCKSPVIQLTDVTGNFYRHILAPRATNQKQMSNYFRGTTYDLSERYTDLTSVLFLTFYYAFLFPAGYFLAALTLTVHYWVDKFCLLRIWQPAPAIGSGIARFSRTYFISIAVAVFAVMSSFSFASFPYDNSCSNGTPVSEDYVGSFSATTGEGVPISIEIFNGDSSYRFCDQDMFQYKPMVFPALPSKQPDGGEWMSDEQDFATVYGWTSVVAVALALLAALNRMRKDYQDFFFSSYLHHPKRASPQTFSQIPDMSAYIPGATLLTDPYPILLCDIQNIDSELIPWVDPKHPDYKMHNAIYDVPNTSDKPIFSTVHHWPPPKNS